MGGGTHSTGMHFCLRSVLTLRYRAESFQVLCVFWPNLQDQVHHSIHLELHPSSVLVYM